MNPTYRVPYTNFPAQYRGMEKEVLAAVEGVLATGSYILRDAVRELEKELAGFLKVKEVVGVGSGTDALFLPLYALGIKPGDEVITVSHTFVATIAVIAHCGATPVLADIASDFNMDVQKIKALLTSRTRAILPVHLNGRMCDIEGILKIAQEYGLVVIEDSAQALGAARNGKMAGSWGQAGCFSLHPIKNLGGAGDGGFVATNDSVLADRLRLLRNHGQETKDKISCFGFNSRLDNLQAAILRVKLPRLNGWIQRRRSIAVAYCQGLKNLGWLSLPPEPSSASCYDVYSSFVVRCAQRDELAEHLKRDGIEAVIHWPVPNHKQTDLNLTQFNLPATEKTAKEVISLPIHGELSDEQVQAVTESIKNFQPRGRGPA